MSDKALIIVLTTILIVCAGTMAYLLNANPPAALSVDPPGRPIAETTVQTATPIGGPFEMTNHMGKVVTEADFDGQYKLIFFGFTNCPGICPGELTKMSDVLEILDEQQKSANITPLFVTIDPERDGVEEMREYVGLFDPRIIGLTGTAEQTADIMENYKVYASRVEMEMMGEGNYMMDHSTFTYLMSPDNELLLVFDMQDKPEEIVAEIKTVL